MASVRARSYEMQSVILCRTWFGCEKNRYDISLVLLNRKNTVLIHFKYYSNVSVETNGFLVFARNERIVNICTAAAVAAALQQPSVRFNGKLIANWKRRASGKKIYELW